MLSIILEIINLLIDIVARFFCKRNSYSITNHQHLLLHNFPTLCGTHEWWAWDKEPDNRWFWRLLYFLPKRDLISLHSQLQWTLLNCLLITTSLFNFSIIFFKIYFYYTHKDSYCLPSCGRNIIILLQLLALSRWQYRPDADSQFSTVFHIDIPSCICSDTLFSLNIWTFKKISSD